MRSRSGIAAVAILAISSAATAQDRSSDGTRWVSQAATHGVALTGELIDAARDAHGRVYLADGGSQLVHVLDQRLQAVGAVGGPGTGPGQYRQLQAVRSLGSSSFATADRVLRRIYVYRWFGSRPRLVRTIELPFEPYDLCPLSASTFIVLGNYQGRRIHAIDSTGNITASAAPFPRGVSQLLADWLIDGHLACLHTKDAPLIVVWTPKSVPVFDVFAGRDVGTLRKMRTDSVWPVRRVSITSGTITTGRWPHRVRRPSITFSSERAGYHSLGRAILASRGFVIPTRIRGRADGVRDDSISTFTFVFGHAGVQRRAMTSGRLIALQDGTALSFRAGARMPLAIVVPAEWR